ncbi:hypothetical protein ACSFB8_07725 [Enterococcus faecalis]
MQELQKYSYQIRTLSKLILSPRQQQAFYRGIDFNQGDIADETALERGGGVNIIYPFYQKGEYHSYQKDCQAYIPGSSLKGALQADQTRTKQQTLMVNDISVNPKNLGLYHLNKVKNTSQVNNKILKLGTFFPNQAIQMCKNGVSEEGELFSEKSPNQYFRTAHKKTIKKISQWQKEVESLLDGSIGLVDSKTKRMLRNSVKKLTDLEKKRSSSTACLIFLGGYKGMLLSMELPRKAHPEEFQSGIYLDIETSLPYGLVEISEVKVHE